MSIQAVKELLKPAVAYNPTLALMIGSPAAAVMLSQGMYWQMIAESKGEEWFWVTADGWRDQCGLTQNMQDTARQLMRNMGFWFEKKAGLPAKLYYKIDTEVLVSRITEYLDSGKRVSYKTGNKVPVLRETSNGRYGRQASRNTDVREINKDYIEISKENTLAPDGASLKVSIFEMKEETVLLKTDSEPKAPPSPAPPPKRSKAEPKPPALIHEMVKRFEDAHKKHFSPDGVWIGFAWGDSGKNGKSGGKQFAGLAGLKEKLIGSFTYKMFRIPDDAEILDSFSKFLEVSVEADPFVLANWFTPCLLNSNYQSIIQRIHNARQPKNITNGPRGNTANTTTTGVFNQGINDNGKFDPKYGY